MFIIWLCCVRIGQISIMDLLCSSAMSSLSGTYYTSRYLGHLPLQSSVECIGFQALLSIAQDIRLLILTHLCPALTVLHSHARKMRTIYSCVPKIQGNLNRKAFKYVLFNYCENNERSINRGCLGQIGLKQQFQYLTLMFSDFLLSPTL